MKELPFVTIKPGSEVILTTTFGVFAKYKVKHIKEPDSENVMLVIEKIEDLP